MTKLKTLWNEVRDSLWFLPTLLTLAGAGLAVLLVTVSDRLIAWADGESMWWLFGGSAEGAQGVLSAISGSIITVTGVVFSVTIVALQLASSQFTPRVLRQFTADRANQLVLGVFIGTFTYTLLVQRTIRTQDGGEAFVPELAVTGAVVLALTSIGFLIFFINHAARSIQASVIIDSVTRDTLRVVSTVFPERMANDDESRGAFVEDYSGGRQDRPFTVGSIDAGYVQAIDVAALRSIARTEQVLVQLEVDIGRHVLPGQTIASVWPGEDVTPKLQSSICEAFVLGLERTPHQDVTLGVIELMDMAVKALSPSVNDPTTAMHAIDRMGEILLALAWRRRGDRIELHDNGRPLVLLRRPRLNDVAALAFNQIRHFAADNPTVSIAMMLKLGELSALAPAEARPVFIEHLRAVESSALQEVTDPLDRDRVRNAAAAALARAAESRARDAPDTDANPAVNA